MKKILPEEFAARFNQRYNNQFRLLSKYTGMKDKVMVRCNTCMHEHEVIAEHLLARKHRCPNCTQYKKFQYYDRLTKDIPKDFLLLNIIQQTRIIKHLRCGAEFKIDRVKFQGRCPVCEEESKYLLLDSSLRKKFAKIIPNKEIVLDDGKKLTVDFYIPELDVYLDLYGDFLKYPMGRPNIFMPYRHEIYLKQEHCQAHRMKYLCIQDRNDLLDIIYDLNMYFKQHKCTYKHFCRWRCSNKLKKIKIKE